MKAILSLSNLVYPICTYHGNIDFSESESDIVEQDIENGYLPENNDKGEKIDYGEVWWDNNYIQRWKDKIPSIAKDCFNTILEPTLEKYGIKLLKYKFYQPKEYNFEIDSLDIEYEYEYDDLRPELVEYVKEYIETQRKESCDGYMSLEPTDIREVRQGDYAYIWAILKKENKIEQLKDIFENEFILELYSEYCAEFTGDLFKYAEEQAPEFFKRKDIEENSTPLPFNL